MTLRRRLRLALLIGGCAACQPNSGGERVSLGTRSLWFSCQGTGRPPVMLEAGHNETSETWTAVQRQVAAFTRVCRYDRAGRGRSDPDSTRQPRTGSDLVADLQAVLVRVDSAGPYLLVGHSLGGAFVRLYAASFPDKIAGLVLLDAVHERELEVVDEILTPEQRAAGAGMQPLSAEGIDVEGVLSELRTTEPRPTQPVIVTARGRPLQPDEMPATWSPEQRLRREQLRKALQANLARMHARGELVIAGQSGHFIHQDQPDLVLAAIRELVAGFRDARVTRAERPND